MSIQFDGPLMIGKNVFVDLRNVFIVQIFENRPYLPNKGEVVLLGYNLYVNNVKFMEFAPEQHDEAVKLMMDILNRMKKCQ